MSVEHIPSLFSLCCCCWWCYLHFYVCHVCQCFVYHLKQN